jgi:hypothetical protein
MSTPRKAGGGDAFWRIRTTVKFALRCTAAYSLEYVKVERGADLWLQWGTGVSDSFFIFKEERGGTLDGATDDGDTFHTTRQHKSQPHTLQRHVHGRSIRVGSNLRHNPEVRSR